MKNLIIFIALLSICSVLGNSQFQESRSTFQSIDSNKDYCISKNELETYRSENSDFMTGKTINEIFALYDKDQDKCISFKEYLFEYYEEVEKRGYIEQHLKQIFDTFDINKSECIEFDELYNLLYVQKTSSQTEEYIKTNATLALELTSLDGNKCLDRYEFYLSCIYQ